MNKDELNYINEKYEDNKMLYKVSIYKILLILCLWTSLIIELTARCNIRKLNNDEDEDNLRNNKVSNINNEETKMKELNQKLGNILENNLRKHRITLNDWIPEKEIEEVMTEIETVNNSNKNNRTQEILNERKKGSFDSDEDYSKQNNKKKNKNKNKVTNKSKDKDNNKNESSSSCKGTIKIYKYNWYNINN